MRSSTLSFAFVAMLAAASMHAAAQQSIPSGVTVRDLGLVLEEDGTAHISVNLSADGEDARMVRQQVDINGDGRVSEGEVGIAEAFAREALNRTINPSDAAEQAGITLDGNETLDDLGDIHTNGTVEFRGLVGPVDAEGAVDATVRATMRFDFSLDRVTHALRLPANANLTSVPFNLTLPPGQPVQKVEGVLHFRPHAEGSRVEATLAGDQTTVVEFGGASQADGGTGDGSSTPTSSDGQAGTGDAGANDGATGGAPVGGGDAEAVGDDDEVGNVETPGVGAAAALAALGAVALALRARRRG